jgi:PKD repeat protein
MAEKGDGAIIRTLASACICLALLACVLAGLPGPAKAPEIQRAPGGAMALPASQGDGFTRNLGQMADPSILFHSRSGDFALSSDSVIVRAGDGSAVTGVRITFLGANDMMPQGESEAAWKSSFFRGSDPAGWISGVSSYGSVVYRNLWEGVDLRCSMAGGLKMDFTIAPHADHSAVRLGVEGHAGLDASRGGELRIRTGLGDGFDIIDSGLDVYYDNGERLHAAFRLLGPDSYGFEMADRDMSRAVTIDPLISSAYLGGTGFDECTAVAAGADGSIYVAGNTQSFDFPTTPGSYRPATESEYDIFIAKLSPGGDELLYSTYISGEAVDMCSSISVDAEGSAYISGYTGSRTFPTTNGAFDRSYNGDSFDAFVTKVSGTGEALVYSTYAGGDRVDQAFDIFVDADGFAYITGETWSTLMSNIPGDGGPFPTTGGSLAWSKGLSDIFVTKLDREGGSLEYSAAFGSGDYDSSQAIAVDNWGYAYITGYTRSNSFTTSTSAFQRSFGGGRDAFVTKLSPTGVSMAYSTYLGGIGGDIGLDIAVGEWGHAYVTGYTYSRDFPLTPNAFDRSHNGDTDMYLTVLDRFGESLYHSTLLGGSGADSGASLALSPEGIVYVAGQTTSADFPVTPGAYSGPFGGAADAFAVKLMPSGEVRLSTYLGGNATDAAAGIALSTATGYVSVAGATRSADFPATGQTFGPSYSGGSDGFLTCLDLTDPVARAGPDRAEEEDAAVRLDGSASADNVGIANWTWTLSDGGQNLTYHGATANHIFQTPGEYTATLNVTDINGNWAIDTVDIDVLDITPPMADAGPDIAVDEDAPIRFNGTASTDNVAIANYTWSLSTDGMLVRLSGPTPAFAFRTPGSYEVSLTVADEAGNAARDATLVTVRDITAPVADAGPDIRVRRGSVVEFNGTGSSDNLGIAGYTWTVSGESGSVALQGSRPSRAFPSEGVFRVTLNVTDQAGQWDIDEMTLTVLETENPVAEAGPDLAMDEQAALTFDGSACTDNVGVVRWSWEFTEGGNPAALLGERPTWTFTVPGVYRVLLNASDAAGNWDTDTLTVTVADALPPEALPGPNAVLRAGETAILDGSSSRDSSGIVAHRWSFTHNGTLQTLEGERQEITLWTQGTYEVTLEVEDGAGKTASAVVVVTVLPPQGTGGAGAEGATAPLIATGMMLALVALLAIRLRGKGGAT